MAKKSGGNAKRQIHESGRKGTGGCSARNAGAISSGTLARFNSLGHYATAGGRSVTINWEGGGITSQQGEISDAQWDIFKLAFETTGRIAILSDLLLRKPAMTIDF